METVEVIDLLIGRGELINRLIFQGVQGGGILGNNGQGCNYEQNFAQILKDEISSYDSWWL